MNGILTVTGTEKATGKKEVIVIENSLSIDAKQLSEAKNKINELTGSSDSIETRSPTEQLIQEIESKLDTFSNDDRDSAEELIGDLREAMNSGDQEQIEELSDALSDLKFYIESNV